MHANTTASEYLPEYVAVAETAMAIDRECRMIGRCIVKIEPADLTSHTLSNKAVSIEIVWVRTIQSQTHSRSAISALLETPPLLCLFALCFCSQRWTGADG